MNYYNEWDKGAAAWLRELIKAGHIPQGVVDERSITEIKPADLAGFTQCHFFAGVAGWSLALQIAGVPPTQPLWTGSPPCQPFSVAGAGAGKSDVRHLAPAFLDLVAECRPQLLFGEQVAAAVKKDQWADALLIELEEEGYTSGFAVLPACGVGAPHKRDRLFFGATLANTSVIGRQWGRAGKEGIESRAEQRPERLCDVGCNLADADDTRLEGRQGMSERAYKKPAGARGMESSVAQSLREQQRPDTKSGKRDEYVPGERQQDSAALAGLRVNNSTSSRNSFWSDADWLGCRDGKFRPVEPGTFPLAYGVSARVGRLRGYGNAIVPQVAAEFIKAFLLK